MKPFYVIAEWGGKSCLKSNFINTNQNAGGTEGHKNVWNSQ